MAQTKVSALTESTSPAGTEELLINDGGTSKKITIANAVKATDLPTAPSGITTDTSKKYSLKLTDSSTTETLSWLEDTLPTLPSGITTDTSKEYNLKLTDSSTTETLSWVEESALDDVADDTTPQLGGDLDVNGNDIVSTANADIDIIPHGTGDVNLGADTVQVGDNDADATITTQGTGDLILNTNNGTNAGNITLADGANGDISITPNGTGNVVLGGDLDCNGSQIQWSQGTDVASATALAVLTDGNYFDVTGTTTITSINTTGGVGTLIKLHFDDALTLTHHATDLILPSGANITTAAGDEAEFIEYASGDYRCTNYSKASGEAVIGGAGATGGGSDEVFYENDQTVTTNYELTANKNAMSAGAITINSSISVTVPSGATWVIV